MTNETYTHLKDIPWPNSDSDEVLLNGLIYTVYTCFWQQFNDYQLTPGSIVMAREKDEINSKIWRRVQLFPGPLSPGDYSTLASNPRRYHPLSPRYRG